MREITSHRVNGCNESIDIFADDRETVGGAPVGYQVDIRKYQVGESPRHGVKLMFQDGPIAEVGTNGITHEALLAVLIDRLQGFQRGQYACRENALALTKLEEAMFWLNSRTKQRVARGVEGTHQK